MMMVFVYARIFHAARSRARRHIQQKRLQFQTEVTNDPAKEKSTTTTTCTSLSNPSPPDLIDQNNEGGDDGVVKGCKPHTPESSPIPISPSLGHQQNAAQLDHKRSPLPCPSPTAVSPPQIVVEAIAESHCSPPKDIAIISNNYDTTPTPIDAVVDEESEVQFKCIKEIRCSPEIVSRPKRVPPKLTIILPDSNTSYKGTVTQTKQNGSATRTTETRFISGDEDSDANESPLSRDTLTLESKTFLSAPKLLRSQYGSTLSIADYEETDVCIDNDVENSDDNVKPKKPTKGGKGVQYHDPPVTRIRSTTSDAERHKRKIAKARERRATLILGLIMAAFITAWLPFFVLYVLAAVCRPCKEFIPAGYFSFAFWLGYCNSGKTLL